MEYHRLFPREKEAVWDFAILCGAATSLGADLALDRVVARYNRLCLNLLESMGMLFEKREVPLAIFQRRFIRLVCQEKLVIKRKVGRLQRKNAPIETILREITREFFVELQAWNPDENPLSKSIEAYWREAVFSIQKDLWRRKREWNRFSESTRQFYVSMGLEHERPHAPNAAGTPGRGS